MYEKKLEIRIILYAAADRMETGFFLNNRPKRAENTLGWRHSLNYYSFVDNALI